jgi:hypothetical protein
MNHLYFKNQFYGLVISFCILQSGIADAQHPSTSKHNDRFDLVANINKVSMDQRNIEKLKNQISISRESDNKKSLKIHREKLALEKKNLKNDYKHACEQEYTYKKNKTERIKQLEEELKASNEHYESIRTQIKKDLSKKNDFALQKDASELLSAVQVRNETSTKLSMEKSDLIATENAINDAWKKVKQGASGEPVNIKSQTPDSNLTTK